MASLALKNIVKDFGTTRVLHGVDLEIADGAFVVFVGPSGCGKSTLLRIICGLEEASVGDIMIDAKRVNHLRASDRGLAMVFQSYALYPHMSVYRNMAFGLENMGLAKKDIQTKVADAAKLLQLDALLERKPTQLSGGQRQRVAIGRAIVREPKMFLFDEPLSNLDAELRVSMRSEITSLHRRLKTTMIYVTHDQVEAMTMADQIVVLRQGHIEQVGSPLELYNQPANRFVAGFIGSPHMNFIPVTKEAEDIIRTQHGATITLSTKEPVAAKTPLLLGIRPEHLSQTQTEGALTLPMQVTEVEQLGGHALLYGHLPGGITPLTATCEGQHPAQRGDQIMLYAKASACHLFEADGKERALR